MHPSYGLFLILCARAAKTAHQDIAKARKPKTQTDNVPHVPSLEGNDGIPQDKGHPLRNAPLRTQEHQEPLVHTQLVTFEDDDYTCKAAANVKNATELIEASYEYVCEVDNVKLFRKSK